MLLKLLEAERPVTAYELLHLIRPTDTASTPASIYRSLDFLLEVGFGAPAGQHAILCRMRAPGHPHAGQFLICRECGTVVETEDTRIATATVDLGECHDFRLDHQTVELTGVCGACRSDDAAAKGAAEPDRGRATAAAQPSNAV